MGLTDLGQIEPELMSGLQKLLAYDEEGTNTKIEVSLMPNVSSSSLPLETHQACLHHHHHDTGGLWIRL